MYYLILPFIYLVSLLPFRVLYAFSDIIYILIFKLLRYRKKVVYENLSRSFPEKSTEEIDQIARKFYRYFCDLFLETFKTLTISPQKMLEHCKLDESSQRLLDRLAAENQSVLLVLGHKGNWEWAGNTFSLLCKHQLYVIYHPLSSKHFDGLMYKMRTRFGTKLIAMQDTFKEMLRERNQLSATAFIADQTPQPDGAYWMNFLHQDTPVFLGTEKIALKMKRPVLFVSVQRVKRGYYSIVINEKDILLPESYPAHGALTEAHTRLLEKEIEAQPETWLWTHRRWKYTRNK